MHLETDPKTHGHFEQTRVGKTTVNSRLFVPNVLDYEQNPNQIMNDIIKLRHSSNGDTYKFHRIFPLDFYVSILTFIPIVDLHPCKKGSELNAYSMSSSFTHSITVIIRSNLYVNHIVFFH